MALTKWWCHLWWEIQGVSKKSVIWKSGTFCFINQLSNDFQQITLITCKNLVHCGYIEYKTFSDDQVWTEIWLARLFDQCWCICIVDSFVAPGNLTMNSAINVVGPLPLMILKGQKIPLLHGVLRPGNTSHVSVNNNPDLFMSYLNFDNHFTVCLFV